MKLKRFNTIAIGGALTLSLVAGALSVAGNASATTKKAAVLNLSKTT